MFPASRRLETKGAGTTCAEQGYGRGCLACKGRLWRALTPAARVRWWWSGRATGSAIAAGEPIRRVGRPVNVVDGLQWDAADQVDKASFVVDAARLALPDLNVDSGSEDLEKSIPHVLDLILEPRRGGHLQHPLVSPRIGPALPGPQLHYQHLGHRLVGWPGRLGGARKMQMLTKLLPDFLSAPEHGDGIGASQDLAGERDPAIGTRHPGQIIGL